MNTSETITKTIVNPIIAAFKYVIPVIVLYSIALAIVSYFGVSQDIPDAIFLLVGPLLTALIANAIKPRLLLIPGLLVGLLITPLDIGIFGGIISGLLLGHGYVYIKTHFFLDEKDHVLDLKGLFMILISSGMAYVFMSMIIGPPIRIMLDWIEQFVASISTGETLLIVLVLATLNTIDLGGPFNKLSLSFSVHFFKQGYYYITGPLMISIVIPPLALLTMLLIVPSWYQANDHKQKKWLLIGGLFGMTETSIPIALRRPHIYIPVFIIGAIVGSGTAVLFGIENVLLMGSLPGIIGVNFKVLYILAHIIGVVVSVGLLLLILHRQQRLKPE